MQGKPVKESYVETVQQVMPGDTNVLGTVFGGKVMQWIDIAGAVSAMRHVRRPVVTASFDRVDFHAPARIGHFLILKAQVNYTGRTSLEVEVTVNAEDPMTGDRFLTTNALITFVAIDQNSKPVPVPPVIPETEDEKKRFEDGKKRREERIKNKTVK
jgi:acyl-CoA hydrolase